MPRFNRLSDAADSARTNNLSFKFGKFDLAFTVSEEYLNKTLKSMWAMGGLPTTLTMEDKSKGGIVKTKMVAECGPTRISLDGVDSQSGRKEIFQDGSAEVLVTIPVLSGTYVSGVYDFDKGKVVYMKRTLGPNDGVIISYVVKLDIGSVASGIDTKGFQLTKEVKDQTDSWSNEMFDPHYLYMNFEDPNIIGSFKIASNAPLDGSTGTEAIKTQDALATSYLNESKKKNSFVFAAIKVAKDKRANSFNLTGATFSIDRKSPHPYQRSLSYLFVTGEEPAPSAVGNFSYSSGDKGGYLTTFHLPARMYYNPRKFIDVIQTSVFNKMKADTKYKNLKNGGDGITFNVVVDDDNTVEGTIKLRLAAGTQDVYMDTRVTTKVPQKFLFINTNADVTYWKEMGYKSTMTLDDKTKSGLKISNFVEVGGSEREGNNMTTGQIVLKAISFLNVFTAVSQIIQLVNDAEGDAAVDSVSASSAFNMLGHNIVMPGQDKLIFKGFGINPHGVPNIQALYNLKRPLEEESAHRIPDGIVNIRSASSHNYLDGRGARSTGTDKLFLTNRSPAGDTYLQWEIIPYGETFALRSVSSGNYLDGRGPGMTGLHQVALTNRSPDGDAYLQWEVVPYGETFALRSVSSRNYLDGRDPADTGPQVALTNRIPEGDIYLQWEITSAVGIGSETTPAEKSGPSVSIGSETTPAENSGSSADSTMAVNIETSLLHLHDVGRHVSPKNVDAFSCTGDDDDFLLFSIGADNSVEVIRKSEDSATGFSAVHLCDDDFKRRYKALKVVATKGADGEAVVAVISESAAGFVFHVCTDFTADVASSDRWTLCGNLMGDEVTRLTVDTTLGKDPVLAVGVRSGAEVMLYHYDRKQKSLLRAPSAMEAYGLLDLSASHSLALEKVSEGEVDFLLASLHKVTPGGPDAKAGLVLTSFPDNKYFNSIIDVDDDTRTITTVNRPGAKPGVFSDLFVAGSKVYYYDTKAQITTAVDKNRVQIPGPLLQTPKKMEAELDKNGNLHLWVLQSNGDLSYTYQDPRNGGKFTELTQFAMNIGHFSSHVNADGSLHLFTVDGAAGNIVHNFMENASMTWLETPISLPSSNDVVDIQVCMTEMSIDTEDEFTSFPEFFVTSSKPCFVKLNGKGVFLNKFTPKKVKPHANGGVIQIAQSMDSMSLARIKVDSPALEQPLEIDGNGLIHKKLKSTTGSLLKHAKATDAYGNNDVPVSAEKDEGKLDDAAKYISQLASAAEAAGNTRVKPPAPSSKSFMKVQGSAVDQGLVSVLGGGEFNTLDTQAMEKFLTKRPPKHTKRRAVPSKLSLSWIMKQIQHDVAAVTDFFVEVADGFVQFYIEIGNAVLQFAVDVVEELMPLLGVVWKYIKAGLKEVLRWLGDLIGIDDILDTTQALKKITNDGIDYFADTLLASLQDKVDDHFESLKETVRSFDSKKLLGKEAYNKTPNEAERDSNGNSLMKNQKVTLYNNHIQNGTFDSSDIAIVDRGAGADDDQEDEEIVEWTDLLDKFKDLATSSSAGEMLDAIQDILEGLIDLAQSAVDGMFDVVRKGIHLLKDMLNSPASIPLVGPIIKAMTGEDVSLLDFMCFLIAAPTTWIWKLTHDGKAPFPGGAAQFPSVSELMPEEEANKLEIKPMSAHAPMAMMARSPVSLSISAHAPMAMMARSPVAPSSSAHVPMTALSNRASTDSTKDDNDPPKVVETTPRTDAQDWIAVMNIATSVTDMVKTGLLCARGMTPLPAQAEILYLVEKGMGVIKLGFFIASVALGQPKLRITDPGKIHWEMPTVASLYGLFTAGTCILAFNNRGHNTRDSSVPPVGSVAALVPPLWFLPWDVASTIAMESVLFGVWIGDRLNTNYERGTVWDLECCRACFKFGGTLVYSVAPFLPKAWPRVRVGTFLTGVAIREVGAVVGIVGAGMAAAKPVPELTRYITFP